MNVSIRVSLDTANLLASLKQCEKDSFDAVIQRRIASAIDNVAPADHDKSVADCTVPPRGRRVYLGTDVHSVATAKEAMLLILRYLGAADPCFWRHLSARLVGRCRNHLASRREAVYPGRPDLDKYIVEIVPGWFLGTNLSNAQKSHIIRLARELAEPALSAGVRCDLNSRGA